MSDYTPTGAPTFGAVSDSSEMQTEFTLIATAIASKQDAVANLGSFVFSVDGAASMFIAPDSFGAQFPALTTGASNTIVGASTPGPTQVSGASNSIFGLGAGAPGAGGLTGSANSFFGTGAGQSGSTGNNNTCVGFSAKQTSASAANEVTLGNSSVATLRCQVTSITALSDARDKADIAPIGYGLRLIEQLNPVRYTWNMRDGGKVGTKDCGFIAQELLELDDEYLQLVYAANPDKLEASYGRLIPVLVRAVQELSEKVRRMEAR